MVKPITTGVAVAQAVLGMLHWAQPRDMDIAPESMPALDAIGAGQR